MDNKKEIAMILSGLAEIYDKELSESAIVIYYHVLGDYPIEKIRNAANQIVRNKTFNKFPLPSEFIQYIDPQDDLEARALMAAEKVLDMNEYQGGTMSVKFDDPIIHHAILRLGGWVKVAGEIRDLAFNNPKGLPFWKKDFMKIYIYFCKHPYLELPPRVLLGTYDADNIAKGYLDESTGILKLPTGDTKQVEIDGEWEDSIKLEFKKNIKLLTDK